MLNKDDLGSFHDLSSFCDSLSENEFLLFKDYIAKNSGIIIPPEKSYLIETRLSKYIVEVGADNFCDLYKYIISNSDPAMPQKIINAITTNETLWFRDALPWKLMQELLLPRLVGELQAGRKARARIWCAAVSTGQEVYSTVMCVDDYLKKNNITGVKLSDFDFFATDISTSVLEKAKRGRYDSLSIMRGLDDYYKTRYFSTDGSAWDIDPAIRESVRFRHFNLQNGYESFGTFDIIFCRYVLIYFSNELKKETILKLHDSLSEDGILFTGNYTFFDLLESHYDLDHYQNLTYYKKKKNIPKQVAGQVTSGGKER